MSYCRVNHIQRRDILLREMGLSEWKLVKTKALKGVVNIPVGEDIQLIIVAEQLIEKTHPFIQDILRSLELHEKDCLIIDFDFLPYLKVKQQLKFWCLTDEIENINKFKKLNLPSLMNLYSSSLISLTSSARQKRKLWQQIQTIN